jgi:hypothetical protein
MYAGLHGPRTQSREPDHIFTATVGQVLLFYKEEYITATFQLINLIQVTNVFSETSRHI